jgi:hypothetical protein
MAYALPGEPDVGVRRGSGDPPHSIGLRSRFHHCGCALPEHMLVFDRLLSTEPHLGDLEDDGETP